jgi:hypothetical protein
MALVPGVMTAWTNASAAGSAGEPQGQPQPSPTPAPPPVMVASQPPQPPPPQPQPAPPPPTRCAQCEDSSPRTAPVVDRELPGRAVVGGDGPGRAIVGDTVPTAEPTPVGIIQGGYAYQYMNPTTGPARPAAPKPAASRGRGSARGSQAPDPAVVQTSFNNDPYLTNQHNRPHIIRHLFGLDAIGARSREERERRLRESHAAISFQPLNEQIHDLPSSMVYGR